jgi:hypothetical protein
MLYLGLGLFAEGRTDHRFLPEVLFKSAFDLCSRGTGSEVEIGPVQMLTYPAEFRGQDRPTQMVAAVREVWPGGIDVLFVHVDGAGDPEAAWDNNARRGVELIEQELGLEQHRVVPVIPIREMEAWGLADGDALRSVFGTSLTNAALGLSSRVREVETFLDPKQKLEEAYQRVLGRAKPKKRAADFLDALGLQTSLVRLRQLPSFRSMEKYLQRTLLDLHFLEREVV